MARTDPDKCCAEVLVLVSVRKDVDLVKIEIAGSEVLRGKEVGETVTVAGVL